MSTRKESRPAITRLPHPGSSRRSTAPQPKGRQIDPAALAAVRDILGPGERRRDRLIEYLHLLQDRNGHLSAAHLAALAEDLGLAQAEVYEVATFYAHFDVVGEDEAPPPKITVRVCSGLSCMLAGSEDLHHALAQSGQPLRVLAAPCMGRCHTPPTAAVVGHHVDEASPETVLAAIASGWREDVLPDYIDLAAYRQAGGYRSLERCIAGEYDAGHVIALLEDSGLKGLGGAGFPPGRKWRIVRSYPGPRYLAVNADEGEPGTFKDRFHLETDPHRVLEGALIAAWVVQAETLFIYLRDEYPAVRALLTREIAALEAAGLATHTRIELRRGAGAYVCGEESAMIESIEGKRGLPRHRPPYVAEAGIFGRPTLVNNVETLYWVRDIIERGPEWFAGLGRNGARGLRSYSVSGRVAAPGVKLAPAGITARELIDEHSGGMLPGHRFRAYLPGGASGGILPASMADLPLDFGVLEPYGSFVGSHAVVVLSDRDDLKQVVLNLMRFFEDESCGQCSPCRIGTAKAVALMEAGRWDRTLLGELAECMRDASICGLGQAAGNPLLCALRYFPEEFLP